MPSNCFWTNYNKILQNLLFSWFRHQLQDSVNNSTQKSNNENLHNLHSSLSIELVIAFTEHLLIVTTKNYNIATNLQT